MSFGILLYMAKVTPFGTLEPLQGFSLQVPFDPVSLPKDCLLYQKPLIRYYSSVPYHCIEFVSSFSSLIIEPHRIIFYKDGVSEGQVSQVLMHEIDPIRKTCASLEDRCC